MNAIFFITLLVCALALLVSAQQQQNNALFPRGPDAKGKPTALPTQANGVAKGLSVKTSKTKKPEGTEGVKLQLSKTTKTEATKTTKTSVTKTTKTTYTKSTRTTRTEKLEGPETKKTKLRYPFPSPPLLLSFFPIHQKNLTSTHSKHSTQTKKSEKHGKPTALPTQAKGSAKGLNKTTHIKKKASSTTTVLRP